MTQRPTLETERLILRPFTQADAPTVQRLVGDRAIAATTLNIPHPYPDGSAETWIATHQSQFDAGDGVTFGIVHKGPDQLIGAMGLSIRQDHARAKLGYWVGKPYWNQGYCTEAASAIVRYGFDELGLNRIQALHFSTNPASGRVMQKIGMSYEGCFREYVRKGGVFYDLEAYAILRQDVEGE